MCDVHLWCCFGAKWCAHMNIHCMGSKHKTLFSDHDATPSEKASRCRAAPRQKMAQSIKRYMMIIYETNWNGIYSIFTTPIWVFASQKRYIFKRCLNYIHQTLSKRVIKIEDYIFRYIYILYFKLVYFLRYPAHCVNNLSLTGKVFNPAACSNSK